MTIYGLPVQSWLLIVVSTGLGLAIVLLFFKGHYRRTRQRWGDGQ